MDYSLYFEDKVNSLIDYLKSNNIKMKLICTKDIRLLGWWF